jgi:hypothetical protein
MDSLDPGIRPYVKILVDEGIETFESCQGGSGHSFPEPTIRFHGQHSEGYRAVAIALQHGLPVECLRRVWDVEDLELVGPDWEIVFYGMAK